MWEKWVVTAAFVYGWVQPRWPDYVSDMSVVMGKYRHYVKKVDAAVCRYARALDRVKFFVFNKMQMKNG